MSRDTLVFTLAAPLQSWGVSSRFGVRDTLPFPSKSGVLGLVCAACGIDRNDDRALAEFAALPLAVRIDRDGMLLQDFHTAQNIAVAKGGLKETDVSTRRYLSDAVFQAALEGEDAPLLQNILNALKCPRWPLSLGRKSCPPGPLQPEIHAGTSALDALARVPWRVRDGRETPPASLACMVECGPGQGMTLNDVPVSFRQGHRKFLPRQVCRVEVSGFPLTGPDGNPIIREECTPCCSTG